MNWLYLLYRKDNGLVFPGLLVTCQSCVHALIRARSLLSLTAVELGSSTTSNREVSSA